MTKVACRLVAIVGAVVSLQGVMMVSVRGAPPAVADPPVAVDDRPAIDTSRFMRLRKDTDGELVALETSIIQFLGTREDEDPFSVDLIGAVHVGEKAYYEQLNEIFRDYDAVLYELVAPAGTRVQKDAPRGGNPVSGLQTGMKRLLELEFQLDAIDYSVPHLVHADMSPEEFAKSMRDRGENPLQMFFRMMGHALAMQNQQAGEATDVKLLWALFSSDRAFELKRILAEQFDQMGGMLEVLEAEKGTTLIGERNQKALDVLKRQMGSGSRRIAIFYGAGHMPDMERRLIEQFQVKPTTTTRWLEAWDLRSAQQKAEQKKVEP